MRAVVTRVKEASVKIEGEICGQIKTGSLSRTDRVAKYNELLRIAEANPDIPFVKPVH